jgi:hypothetical protein
MILSTLLAALIFALLFTLIFSLGLRRRGPWDNFWLFFVIVFLAVLAGGLWITPSGPLTWGVHWLPMFFIALLVSLLLASATPVRKPRTMTEAMKRADEEDAVVAVLGIFFWVMIISFLVVIVVWFL